MRVLIIEDDPGIADGLTATLKRNGYAVDTATTLSQATAAISVESFDLILLDLGLPDGDGLDGLRLIRQQGRQTPVLIMSARDALPAKVQGLDEGADDYLVKPFQPEELLARMRVALRRSEGRAQPGLTHGSLEIDLAARTVKRAGQAIALRTKEFELLMALVRSAGQVITRQRLEEALYSFDEPLESNALDVHIHHLRRKLGDDLVKTVRGVGYFVPRPEPKA
ncbi:MAG: response regulator transcription factor [Burkholderiaceae bacterium]|nr:response regulator transcription factor [Burkholderiaceae bacterium]